MSSWLAEGEVTMACTRLAPIMLLALAACGDDAASPPEGTVTLTLNDPGADTTANGELVAFQDGDGPWTVLTGDQGHYQAIATTGRYGFLIACTNEFGGDTWLELSTTAESTAVAASSCATWPREPLTISGTISHSESGFVEVSSLRDADFLFDEDTYSLATRAGPEQLLVADYDQDFNPGRIVRRDLGSLTTNRVEDVDLDEGLLGTVVEPPTTGFTGAETNIFGGALLFTGGGTLFLPTVDSNVAGDAPPAYLLLAPSQRLPDDRVDVSLFADRGDFDDRGPYASRSVTVRDVTPTSTFALPDLREFAAPTVNGAALTWSLPAQSLAGGDQLFVDARGYSSSKSHDIGASISPGWAAAPHTLTLGDTTQLAGWRPVWTLAGETDWSVTVYHDVTDGTVSSGSRGIVTLGAATAAPATAPERAVARHRARIRAIAAAQRRRVTPASDFRAPAR
jgi:hypothetical protein